MKIASILFLSVLFCACIAQSAESQRLVDNAAPESAKRGTPVLVELFTSEGCSSCPKAERFLARLQKDQPYANTEVITMALHVDYWDELGWKDRFASPLFTQRQRVYDRKFRTGRIYTPQMVVDGEREFVGSSEKKAARAIEKAVKSPKAKMNVSYKTGRLSVKITEIPKHEDASVYVALAEDNLSSNVKRGENAGKSLSHLSVVRKLQALGRIAAGDSSFELETPIQIEDDWNRENLNVIVFVQENKSRTVVGAARHKIREEILPN